MTYNVFGGTLNLAQFNSIHGADTDTGLLAILAMVWKCTVKLEFHDADSDTAILARILADTFDA